MKKEFPRYTLRVSAELLYKLGYIAHFEGRTKNKEMEFMLRKNIGEFERLHGEIPVPNDILEED